MFNWLIHHLHKVLASSKLNMRCRHTFDHEAYFQTLNSKSLNKSGRIVVQKGGGLLGICKRITRIVIPILKTHILPHIKSAAINAAHDIISGNMNIKSAFAKQKTQLASSLRKEASNVLSKQVQNGSGISRKRKRTVVENIKPKKKKICKRKPKKSRSKLDYFT